MTVWVGLLICALAVLATPGSAQENSDRLKVINCYDADRNIVRRVARWKCKGEEVSDARAQEIKASRIRRAKQRMQAGKALFPGMRMRSSGTGFFVSPHGHMLTNDHVVAGCRRISVKPSQEKNHKPARLIGTDKPDDLAVIQYSEKPPRFEYVLTECGHDFQPVLLSLLAWGNKHFAPEGISAQLVDRETRKRAEPLLVDAKSGKPLDFERFVIASGPAAPEGMRRRLADAAEYMTAESGHKVQARAKR